MMWALFFTWLQSFHPVTLQCSFPSLWNMEETSRELPNFSIGIDLLGVSNKSNKNKAEKNSQVACYANLLEDQLQQILALIFTIFPCHKFWAFHPELSVNWIKCSCSNQSFDQPIETFVYFFWCCENFALYHNERLLHTDPCCCSVITEFAHAFSCTYIELWMHTGSLESTKNV